MNEIVTELRPENFTNGFDNDDEVLQISVRRFCFVNDALHEGASLTKLCS